MTDEHAASECSDVLARIYEFLDGEVTEREADEIRLHLDACEHCLDQTDIVAAVQALVRRCCVGPPAPPALRERLYARYHVEHVRVEVRRVEIRLETEGG